MDLEFSEDQEMLRKVARDFLEDKCPKTTVREIELDEKGYSPDLWQEMAGLGWQGMVLPEKYGGTEMTFLDLCVLFEEIGRACLPSPLFPTVIYGAMPILEAGSEEQKDKYLPDIAEGNSIFTMALIEPQLGNGPHAVKTEAKQSGDGYTLNGTKLFVPYAHVADYFLCVARTSGKEEGISIFIVDANSSGVKTTVLQTMANDKLCEVVLDNVQVPKENVLGSVDQGWPQVQKIMERNDTAKCCELVGNFQWVLEDTIAYANDRKQFGRPIGSFQVIQHYCADLATYVEGTRLSAYQAAWRINEDIPCTKEVAVAKAWTSKASPSIFDIAHQVHGAMGVTLDHDLHFYTRRSKPVDLTYDAGDCYREVVANEMGLK
ncbi:MAG: acyl-CoA dehydrogenase family protein [Chloroflexota bacterium]